MTLKSLVGISLEPITPARETIKRLLDGASRHIADAKVRAVSAETRFGSAYTAVRTRQCGCSPMSGCTHKDTER